MRLYHFTCADHGDPAIQSLATLAVLGSEAADLAAACARLEKTE